MTDWLDELAARAVRGESAILLTVAKTEGSAPREAGAKMIVARESAFGTIGGGYLELEATRRARALLDAPPAAPSLERFTLEPEEEQACGGTTHVVFERFEAPYPRWIDALRARRDAGDRVVRLVALDDAGAVRLVSRRDAGCEAGPVAEGGLPGALRNGARELFERTDGPDAMLVAVGERNAMLERVRPSDFNVVLFGAGHVGAALARVLGTLPCRVTWVDERESQFPAEPSLNVRIVRTDDPAAEVRAASPGAFFLVMTHSHGLDLEICAAVLARRDFRYFGVIGSNTKRRQFERRLAERGFSAGEIGTLRCPIGIAGIKSKDPSVIAVAVAAELLQAREAAAVRSEGTRQTA